MTHLPANIAYALQHHGPLDIHMESTDDGRTRVVLTSVAEIVDLTSVVGLHPAEALANALASFNL